MRVVSIVALLLIALITGCQNAHTLARQNQGLAKQQQQLAMQGTELRNRASSLDKDNQELESLLAQARQQNQLMKDQLAVVREQLRSTSRDLAEMRSKNSGLEKHTQALAASVKRRASASITANNSYVGELTVLNLPGIEARQDGDVVRIELPGEKLFHPGSATLKNGSLQVIDGVMADIIRTYPEQVIGIEGHTDSDPISTPHFPTNHHLSTARAMAVYTHVAARYRLPPQQIFVAGHGSNQPVVSNATKAGKERNRRVELVIYPERINR